jgi:single-stranded-DNA-specific exonuclease
MAGLVGNDHWNVLSPNEEAERRLRRELALPPLVARVLVSRGFADPAAAREFLTPSLERDWLDPLLIPGMREAADRVELALERHETIAIFGDFDVDGMSAASLLSIGLTSLGGDVHAFIPDRFEEGYGLSETALDRVVATCDPDLVITVDNGISAGKEVEQLLARGIDCVVTDHHEPADLVPQGVPVADPKLSEDCASRDLAGVGVALKLVCELGRRLEMPDLWRSLTDLACLGTISDMMELTGENRALVTDGIAHMRQSSRPGIVTLAAAAGTDLSQISADDLPFSIIPRLNAAGRMGSVDVAFRLLLTDSFEEASQLAGRLEQINSERRETEALLSERAMEQVEASWSDGHVVVAAGEGWHEGVKGIVASRLVSRYHVPAIVFSIVGDEARGSGRSVGSIDLFHAVEQCADLTIRFGGHAGAVGVTVAADKIDEFRARLDRVLSALPAEQFIATQEVTAIVRLDEISIESIEALDALQPFGMGNKKPLFGVRGVSMRNRTRAGAAGAHLRFVATDGISQVPAIMFRVPNVERAAGEDGVVDLVFEAVNETWQGRTKAKLMVKDILYRDGEAGEGEGDDAEDALDAALGEDVEPALVPASAPGPKLAGSADSSTAALTEALVREMIGENPLLTAQEAALARLESGLSTLLVMATGRGKSLVFHVHAAREALRSGRASILVYPLRALVADQSHQLVDVFGRLGIGARVLCGMTAQQDRASIWAELAHGSCDVLLTTPEFLAIHAQEFAACGRVGFLVIDEAHHLMQEHSTRPAYASLPRVRELLGDPCVLAVTATADAGVAEAAGRLLGIPRDGIICDEAVRDNLQLRDCRELRNRELALASLVATGEKSVIYVNSRDESVAITRMLRHAVGELADRIAYYNAGMSAQRRALVEAAFRDGRLCCIVSTSAFGEGVNVPDIRNVVLYHLPFGRTEFNQMSGRGGRDGQIACIWLMFSARDAAINERLLASAAPTRDELVALWRALRSLADGDGRVICTDEDIAARASSFDRRCALDVAGVDSGVAVFSELGFLAVEWHGDQRTIVMAPSPERMTLEASARYVEGQHAAEDFAQFREWVLTSTPGVLLQSVNRPITPFD